MKRLTAVAVLMLCLNCFGQKDAVMDEKNPVNQQGTVSFVLHTDRHYQNGQNEQDFQQVLLELPGLGKSILQKSSYGIFLIFAWEKQSDHSGFYMLLSELPGPEQYVLQFTWDADKGFAEGYINGIPYRTEKFNDYAPWKVNGSATGFTVPAGPNKITDIKISSKYLGESELKKLIPESFTGKNSTALFEQETPAPVTVKKRKGRLLYTSSLGRKTDVKDWVLEGPGVLTFNDDKMILQSSIPNPPDGSTGHFNLWCPVAFPEKIVVEWEFQPLSDHGVCHLFFGAAGTKGENVFDPALPKRDGHFQQYINGAVKNYYIIYFSNRRLSRTTNFATTWLVKSVKPSLLTLGKVAVSPVQKKFHRMCLVKDGSHIQLLADGEVCLDYVDPGNERTGKVIGGGHISFRQMAVTKAAYRNFKVWELK